MSRSSTRYPGAPGDLPRRLSGASEWRHGSLEGFLVSWETYVEDPRPRGVERFLRRAICCERELVRQFGGDLPEGVQGLHRVGADRLVRPVVEIGICVTKDGLHHVDYAVDLVPVPLSLALGHS